MAQDYIENYLKVIRTANSGETVRDAIINCMRDINADSAIRSTNLVITSADNVTHTAPKGYAFKNVTVNINNEGTNDPSNTYRYEELSVTLGTPNGTYPPESQENVAYSKVIVELDQDAISSTIVGEEATMTYTQTDPTTGKKFWMPQFDSDYEAVKLVWIGSGSGVNLPDYPYAPGSGGGQGGENGPYVVTFYNEKGTQILSVKNVPKYGSVYTTEPNILSLLAGRYAGEYNGKLFSGWTCSGGGSLEYVTSNITAKPNYTFQTPAGTIEKSWNEIMLNKGADLGIGSTIQLISEEATIPAMNLSSYATCYESGDHATALFPSKHVSGGAFNVQLMVVAHGEGGTTTTFLATNGLINSFLYSIYDFTNEVGFMPQGESHNPYIRNTNYGCDDMVGCIYYKILTKAIYYLMPDILKDNIKQCSTKSHYGLTSSSIDIRKVRQQSAQPWTSNITRGGDKIWLPSYGELRGFAADAIANERANDVISSDPNLFKPESSGGYSSVVDYGSVWVPSDAPTGGAAKMIATRSTLFGASRTVPTSFHNFGLLIHNYTGSEDIRTCVDITYAGSGGLNYDDQVYFGFCI